MHWMYGIVARVEDVTNSIAVLTPKKYKSKVGLLIGITINSIKLCNK